MRLQTTGKLDNALSGFKIIEFLVRKEQSVFGGRVHRGQWGLFGFPPRKGTVIYPRAHQKTCRCLGTILSPASAWCGENLDLYLSQFYLPCPQLEPPLPRSTNAGELT